MTPAKDVRSLIEEHLRNWIEAPDCADDLRIGVRLIREALALLPEWQPFDPKREETWPKEKKWCAVWIRNGDAEPICETLFWLGKPWAAPVICYYVLPLPPPYVKE